MHYSKTFCDGMSHDESNLMWGSRLVYHSCLALLEHSTSHENYYLPSVQIALRDAVLQLISFHTVAFFGKISLGFRRGAAGNWKCTDLSSPLWVFSAITKDGIQPF